MSRLWPQFVDRELGLSRQQRKAIHREAWRLWARDKKNILLYLTLPVVYIVAVPFASDVGGALAHMVGVGGTVHLLVRAASPVLLAAACFVLGGAILQRYRFAPCVYRATRQQGYDVCARCGFWLRGLPDEVATCPECGADRE
ncbi:MAG: hypothetical protein ACYTG1_11070 [Planctomycetota bacterium]|jgi:hypothetical protein